MPTRLIRDGILTSNRVNQLDWEAEVFYRRLLSIGDDYGLFDARLVILRSSLYPLKLDNMRESNIQRCLAMCEAAGLVRLYSVENKQYGEIVNYGQQCKSKPKFPLPPDSCSYHPLPSVTSRNEPLLSATKTKTKTKTKTESGWQQQSKNSVSLPKDVGDVEKFINAQVVKPTDRQIAECSQRFFDQMESVGWVDRNGIPIKNWHAAAKMFAVRWHNNEGNNPRSTSPENSEKEYDPFDPKFEL